MAGSNKRMKVDEFLQMDVSRLYEEVLQLKKGLLALRFQKANGQLEDPMKMRFLKRNIARAKTVLAIQRKKEEKDKK